VRRGIAIAVAAIATAAIYLTLVREDDGGGEAESITGAADVPERELVNGRPTGGAMPLVWAHAEYVKLVRSLLDGRVFDTPPQPAERYAQDAQPAAVVLWSPYNKTRIVPVGRVLRVQTPARALVHWSADDWRTVTDTPSRDAGLGIWATDLDTTALAPGSNVRFTLYWPDEDRWQGEDYEARVVTAPAPSPPEHAPAAPSG